MDKKSRELVMAKLYFKNKDYKMAEKSFNEYLQMSPTDTVALKLLAQVYEQNKRFDKAYEMYERCYLAEPERTGVILDICRMLLINEIWLEHVDYKKWLDLAIKAFPSNPIVVNFKAFLSTSPADEVVPLKPNKVIEDPLNKILDKLSSLDQRLEAIEISISRLNIREDVREEVPKKAIEEAPKETIEVAPKKEVEEAAREEVEEASREEVEEASREEVEEASKEVSRVSGELGNSEGSLKNVPFTFFSNFAEQPPTTNLFAESIKKLNVPAMGFDFSVFNTPAPTPAPKPEPEPEPESDDVLEELPIENFCELKPIEIRTGEEEEEVIFEHRSKLYRFRDKEYRERGLGALKILRHKKTLKVRLIMRRDAIGLVCLNCWECRGIQRVKDTQIKWSAIDSSDGEPTPTVFLAKFKTPEITDTFLDQMISLFNPKSEVELVDPRLDQTLVDKARQLQLPDLFYHKLRNQEPCKGCQGCDQDN